MIMTDLLSDPNAATPTIEDLVGPGKKYADVSELAKAYAHLERHAEEVKSENATYRNELRARTSLEEITERIARQSQVDPTPDPKPVAAPQPEAQPVNISEQVLKILEDEKTKANREQNTERARSGLRERFGADYNLYLKKAASSLNVSEAFLANLAQSSPDGLLKLVDSLSLKDADLGSPPPSSVDTAKQYNQSLRKNSSYYSELRKKDRQKYFSAAVQAEMHNEAVRQGPKFYEP
jgi:hypothetical protein